MQLRRALSSIRWRAFLIRFVVITVGTVISAVSVVVFFAPANIAPGGVTGLGVIVNHLIEFPIGLFVLLGNIPIMYLAHRTLGGWRAVIWTIYAVVLYSVTIDNLTPYLPPEGVSDNTLLNAIFAGVVGGFGGGLAIRGGATLGGTSTLARILQMHYGTPLSSTYAYSNFVVVILAGIFLGWESALFAMVALVIEGAATDYSLEGPSIIRMVIIITNKPREVSDTILYEVHRGVTGWEAVGMYTNEVRHVLLVTIPRSQVNIVRTAVLETDPQAFVIVGQGHVAYGEGFKRSSFTLESN